MSRRSSTMARGIPAILGGVHSHLRANPRLWSSGGLCVLVLLALLARLTLEFTSTPVARRLVPVGDVPLPGAFPDANRRQDPLAPGVSVLFDHFDFQAIDPLTNLLFIAHSGPRPNREAQINPHFDPAKDAKDDGNLVIFNTVQKKVVGLLNIPQVAGIVVAPDLHKIYVADANDDLIYVVDEATLKAHTIPLHKFDGPNALVYDQDDHLIFVSDPGSPNNLATSNSVLRANQNEAVIDAITDKLVNEIPLGLDGRWGDNVGHVRYDPGLRRIFVVVQQAPDPDNPDPNLLPPPGTALLVQIDPVAMRVISRLMFASTCMAPHGLALDTELHIAYIACVDSDPPSLYRVDLLTMKPLPGAGFPLAQKPDILVIDRPLHLLYVGCGAGLVLFKIEGRSLHWLGTYAYGVDTHTVAVNEQTHEIYLPLIRVGGRPVLRIMRYNAAGVA